MAGYLGREACDREPFVFISYNTEDQQRIGRIVAKLPQELNIWYDNGLKRISHEEWQEQIASHIRSSEVVFFFISGGIFSKLDSFVRKEYDIAKRHKKQICIVMLDRIDPDSIPAKYDFWWGEIKSRQCIEAHALTPAETADHIVAECGGIEAFRTDEAAAPAPKAKPAVPAGNTSPQHRPGPKSAIIGLVLSVLGIGVFFADLIYLAIPLLLAGCIVSVIACARHCRLYGISVAGIFTAVAGLLLFVLYL